MGKNSAMVVVLVGRYDVACLVLVSTGEFRWGWVIPDVGKKIVLSVVENSGRVGTGCAVKLGAYSLGAFV